MKHLLTAVMVLSLCGLGARESRAQGALARGQVVDEQGQPLAGVKVEIQYKGKEPKTFVRTTNEKGGYIQVGLPSGPYTITFSKEGYQPAAHMTNITAGGLTEIPTAMLKPAPKAAPPPDAPQEPDAGEVAKEVEAAYGQALEATRAGRLDESEALFKEVLEKVPNLAAAHYNLGYVYSRKKDWPAAEAEFQKTIELQPERSDTFAALALVYEATDRRAEAVKLLSEASSRFEQDASFQYNAGVAFVNAGEAGLAEASLLKARELDPSRAEASYYLGTLAVGKGQIEEAVAYLESYLAASGQNPQNLTTATKLLEALKKPAK